MLPALKGGALRPAIAAPFCVAVRITGCSCAGGLVMFVMWQYKKASGLASQYVVDATQLHALLGVLHRRAVADSYLHAVHLSPGNGNRQTAHGLENGPAASVPITGPQPQLTLVIGADHTPLLWNDNVPAARQISVGPRMVTQPEPQD